MAKLNFENRWVVVTGASSGLGREIARRLAVREKANVIIAARRKERLAQLKQEIEAGCGSKVEMIPVDLSREEGVDRLFHRSVELAGIYAVINNAGITGYGITKLEEMDLYRDIMAVNFHALMKLSLLFLPYFVERGEGALLNITSMGAFVPTPYQNIYAASKHAAQAFSEGLYREYESYRKNGIIISSFAPGGIRTEMITNSGLDKKHPLDSPYNMDPQAAARKAVETLKKKKYAAVPGLMNKLSLFFTKHLPRRMVSRLTASLYRP